jgi:hypothetical protein
VPLTIAKLPKTTEESGEIHRDPAPIRQGAEQEIDQSNNDIIV